MTTALISHPDCYEHVTPDGHPECVDRLRAVDAVLCSEEFMHLLRAPAPLAEDAHLLRCHPQSHLDRLAAAIPQAGDRALDSDTFVSPLSLRAARRAAGANVLAVDMVMAGEANNAFCATRPPGHHAETTRAMGFCLFNNAAVGALHAIERHGLHRVAIMDFDVHHGNGTQEIFERDGRVFYASTHEWPLYPGTGAAHERGAGNILNVPLEGMSGPDAFREAFTGQVLPALRRFRPELMYISAGFDAHARDPLSTIQLSERDFVWATHALCDVADEFAGGRVVSTLEGGYDLEALARSTAAHLRVLMERAG
ncbi:MAG: histone deacetylase family protein [Rubrimonas sp.]|uniref:histone deacetylase family protein n=1 Tax=Rubrimonas sp. TaxID=2036015 RepID=UPI002FDD608D